MIDIARRLHSRGPASRGISVDVDGITLGPHCVLVARTSAGYRCVPREEVAVIQDLIFAEDSRPDWLFEQCQRIVKALDAGQIALAQILGLQIPVEELDEPQLTRLAAAWRLIKANYNPNQLRVPVGQAGGGRWTSPDGGNPAAPPKGAGQPKDTAPPEDAAPPKDDGHIDPGAHAFDAYLQNVGYPLSQEMSQVARDLYRLFRDSGGDLGALREYLGERGLNLGDLPDVIRSALDPPKPLRELQPRSRRAALIPKRNCAPISATRRRDTNGTTSSSRTANIGRI